MAHSLNHLGTLCLLIGLPSTPRADSFRQREPEPEPELFGSVIANAQTCSDYPEDTDLDLCDDFAQCDETEMDLCTGYIPSCSDDEMDLCLDYIPLSTTTELVTTTSTRTFLLAMSTKTGSFVINVDATAAQVESSTEKSMGKLLYDGGVGSSVIEATGYINATASVIGRKLAVRGRQLALTQYTVGWAIAAPLAVAPNVSTFLDNVQSNMTLLENEMLRQFQAAGVTSATALTIETFSVDTSTTLFSDDSGLTDSASRMECAFASGLAILVAFLASAQRSLRTPSLFV